MGQQEGERAAGAAHARGAADAVHKYVRVLGWIHLHDPRHIWDVQPPRRHIRAQQRACPDHQHRRNHRGFEDGDIAVNSIDVLLI